MTEFDTLRKRCKLLYSNQLKGRIMRRREFLSTAGVAIGATALASSALSDASTENASKPIEAADWSALRNLFPLTHDYIHLSTFLLASHPAPVSREIEKHRRGLDENPADYLHDHSRTMDLKIAQSAAGYMPAAALSRRACWCASWPPRCSRPKPPGPWRRPFP